MDKYIYDETRIYHLDCIRIYKEHPEFSIDKIEEMARSMRLESKKTIFQINICRKLQELYRYEKEHGMWLGKQMVKDLPEEMFQSLDEWFDNKEISEIKIQDVSIQAALSYAKGYFPSAVFGVLCCLKDGNARLKAEVIRSWYKCKALEKQVKEYGYFDKNVVYNVDQTIDGLPEELYQNVDEWLSGKPFSNIIIGDLSVQKIRKATKAKPDTCIQLMNDYIQKGCKETYTYLNHGRIC